MKKIAISNYNTLLFYIIRGCFLGICTDNLYTISKQDGWLSIIIASIIGLLPLLMYYFIIKKNPNENIFQITKKILGKTIGNIINIIITLLIFIYAISIFYNLIVFITTQYLYRTPTMAVAIMFGLCFYYLISKGINTIAKTSTILFYIGAILFTLTFIGLIIQTDLSNFLPFNEQGILPIFNGSFHVLTLNITPIFIMSIIPYNKIKGNDKFIKNCLLFYIIGLFSIFFVNFCVISIYGSNLAILFQYPEFHLLKRLSLIGFIERVENVLSVEWIFGMIMLIVISLNFVKEYILVMLKRKRDKDNRIIDLLLIIVSIITAINIFKSNTIANDFYLYILPILNLVCFIIIPFIIFIIILVKKKNYAKA